MENDVMLTWSQFREMRCPDRPILFVFSAGSFQWVTDAAELLDALSAVAACLFGWIP